MVTMHTIEVFWSSNKQAFSPFHRWTNSYLILTWVARFLASWRDHDMKCPFLVIIIEAICINTLIPILYYIIPGRVARNNRYQFPVNVPSSNVCDSRFPTSSDCSLSGFSTNGPSHARLIRGDRCCMSVSKGNAWYFQLTWSLSQPESAP